MKITINGNEIEAKAGQTLLEAALENAIEIPHLCQDSSVEPYGGCGLCLCELENNPRLIRACATGVSEGMAVLTHTDKTKAARKLALELLLSNHRGDCVAPCRLACPGETDCQGYVGLIANGREEDALKLLKESYPLPASLGRVCPHPCEDACRRKLKEAPVSIAALKAYAGDMDLDKAEGYLPERAISTGKRIAIVGAGPSGLTAAWFLSIKGHDVTVFEAMPKAGGMLRYGIPEYRLPKEVLDKEIALVEKMGVSIKTNVKLGEDIFANDLQEKYDAVYIATGAWKSSPLGCRGEEKRGVLGGIDFLRDIALGNFPEIGQKAAIVGGANIKIYHLGCNQNGMISIITNIFTKTLI